MVATQSSISPTFALHWRTQGTCLCYLGRKGLRDPIQHIPHICATLTDTGHLSMVPRTEGWSRPNPAYPPHLRYISVHRAPVYGTQDGGSRPHPAYPPHLRYIGVHRAPVYGTQDEGVATPSSISPTFALHWRTQGTCLWYLGRKGGRDLIQHITHICATLPYTGHLSMVPRTGGRDPIQHIPHICVTLAYTGHLSMVLRRGVATPSSMATPRHCMGVHRAPVYGTKEGCRDPIQHGNTLALHWRTQGTCLWY